ncbi:sensor histidine kinase [Mucilaginibacter hurinus]|uniref:histidine kinase n=1 Tax=Mucilaginibacter hurinus TaxID=2201324 RepID=A0A367GMP2_9SPHI|nr:sensor histidine kinase [Mucilaginibacter hurinus]RCH54744.1 sensor histidine kinase [Mucilaginibacter hurinus]
MTEIVSISLENEMDLVLAHKRSMKVAEKIGLTVATQTTFATAVSEIARAIIEHTDHGNLTIGLEQNQQRYSLVASMSYGIEIKFDKSDAGFYYAQKLVPEFYLVEEDGKNRIYMKMGIPRSLKMDPVKINALKKFFADEEPLNAYEEIKLRNKSLHKLAGEKEEELRQSKIINEQKTEFISIASHEIKTPITIIKAYTQMAKALDGQCSDQVKVILDKVDVQTTKLITLIQQLLDISKIENGSFQYLKEVTELNAFVQEIVEIIKYIIPNHEITLTLCEETHVQVDKLRMEQVLSNLIGNAAKYSQKNTPINITCTINNKGFAQITITDQGIGMSSTTIESIFNKFYRDKDVMQTHAGLGMGLYIASKIVSDHDGEIWVESKEGQGSSFSFTLPAEPVAI